MLVSRDLTRYTVAAGHRPDPATRPRRLGPAAASAGGAGPRPRTRRRAERAVPRASGPVAAVARLSMGRRLGLCEPRGPRAAGPRRRDARELLDRPADVPGRLRQLPGAARSDPDGQRGLGHRPRGRGRGGHRRRADGRRRGGGGTGDPPGHAGQRCLSAQPDPGGTRQGLRLRAGQTRIGLLARGGDAGRAGAGLGWRAAAPAAVGRAERHARSAGPMRGST